MPLAIVFIGLAILVSAVRGTYGQLFQQLASDLPGFAVWLGAILAIGLIGYVPKAEPISRALLALVFVVLIIGKAAFPNFVNAFTHPPGAAPAQPVQPSALGPLPINLLGGQNAPGTGAGAA